MNKAIKLGFFSLILSSTLHFSHSATPGFNIGAGVGAGLLTSDIDLRRDQANVLSGRAFFGYNFTNYLGVETNYTSLGTTHFYSYAYPSVRGDYTLKALSLVGKVFLPFSPESPVNLYALLGGAQMWGSFNISYNGYGLAEFSSSAIVPTAGLGLSYDLTKYLTTGLEVSGFGSKKSQNGLGIPESTLATLSLAYKF